MRQKEKGREEGARDGQTSTVSAGYPTSMIPYENLTSNVRGFKTRWSPHPHSSGTTELACGYPCTRSVSTGQPSVQSHYRVMSPLPLALISNPITDKCAEQLTEHSEK